MLPDNISTAVSDINNWLPNYLGIPYKHLGNTREGIDCFNLICLVYEEILHEKIPYNTTQSGCDIDTNWYSLPKTANILSERACPKWGWEIVSHPRPFDVILISLGSTNAPNHCALFLGGYQGGNKLLQVMEGHPSYVVPYGRYYQQYTIKIGRWNKNLLC